jgi:hypothetical protein
MNTKRKLDKIDLDNLDIQKVEETLNNKSHEEIDKMNQLKGIK